MTSGQNKINPANSPITSYFMPRPRINKILDRLTLCKLVYVIAGAGYGKTQAVYHYIERQPEAVVRWIHLTENDNIGSRYWESLTRNIAVDNPDLSVKLNDLGFPETLARFKQFAGILKNDEHHSNKTFLVLDDFHLIHSKQALDFAERCAHLEIPGACVIIISRKEPEINSVSLFSKGRAGIMMEEDLRFTNDEIGNFLNYQKISFKKSELPQISNSTKGWALAVKLFSLVLKRMPDNTAYALETMKQNIFKLMETEAFNDFTEDIKKSMVKLSLVSDLPLTPQNEIFGENSFIQNIPQLASFMWFDSYIGNYRIHPLYIEFLQNKNDILSKDEENETYFKAAQWCSENSFYYTDAVKYYAKSHKFEYMIKTLYSCPFRMSKDACEYFFDILERLDPEAEKNGSENYNILFLKNYFIPILLIGMGKYEEAEKRSFDVIYEWENIHTPFSYSLIHNTYSNLAYIDTYICTVSHKYNSAEYMKKAMEYRLKSPMVFGEAQDVFSVADLRSFACLVGECDNLPEFDIYLENTKKTGEYIKKIPGKMYAGYDDLAACEIDYYKNRIAQARNHAYNAVFKAREEKQYSIETMAKYYLLRIASHEGDYALITEILNQLKDHLKNPDFWNRQLLYDLFTGSFFSFIGIPEMAPQWLIIDEKETDSEVHIPARELLASVQYYISSHKYTQALAILCHSSPREPMERFHFGELRLSLLLAAARIRTGDTRGAVADFENAYRLSFGGEFEMPFIELGRDLYPLISAVSEQESCAVPKEWLALIERKTSVYIKKTSFIMNSFRKEKKEKNEIQLSDREKKVLNDLYQGLSREDIAENQYLSINTVKKILQSIYLKLDAKNNVEAIRIAIERNLIE